MSDHLVCVHLSFNWAVRSSVQESGRGRGNAASPEGGPSDIPVCHGANLRVDDSHAAFEAIVEVTFATAAGQNLRLDNDVLAACVGRSMSLCLKIRLENYITYLALEQWPQPLLHS